MPVGIRKFFATILVGLTLLFSYPISEPSTYDPLPAVVQVIPVRVENLVTREDEKQIQCLAEAVYYEARDQSTKGKLAVAHVVKNRLKSGKFANTICSVVHAKKDGICQFTWACMPHKIKEFDAWWDARSIARKVYYDKVQDITANAVYFYTTDIRKPSWAKGLIKTTIIDDHVFLRERTEI